MNNISVYLDNCCYNRPYDDQTQLRDIKPFDYTEWRKDKFDDMSFDELGKAAAEYSRKIHSNDNI